MEPVTHKGMNTGGSFRLGDFIFMVREDQIAAAAVEIKGRAQIFHAHGRAFNMPAGPPFTPGGIPGRFTGFGRFPQGKVHGILFPVVHIHPGPCQHIIQVTAGKAAVTREFFHTVIHIAVHHIGESVVNQCLDRIDNVRNMAGYPGINLHTTDIQLIHHLKIRFDVTAADITPLYTLRIRCIDDLVIHVSKILHMQHIVPFVFQETVDHIPGHKGAGVADMRMVIRGYAADINARLPRIHGNKFFFFACHRIVNFNCHSVLLLLPAIPCGTACRFLLP